MATVRITHRGVSCDATEETWQARLDELVQQMGPWEPGVSKVEKVETLTPQAPTRLPEGTVDPEAVKRIAAQREAFRREAGIEVDESQQFYATGTRMAQGGYNTQHGRKREAEKMLPAGQAFQAFAEQLAKEQRRERKMSAGDFGKALAINGKLTVDGYRLQETAIRNLLSRIGSPALGYVMGLRDRIAARDLEGKPVSTPAGIAHDKAELLHTLQAECDRFQDVPLMLRLREGLGDCFTVVSPSYTVADADVVMPILASHLPDGVKALVKYDATTTRWEVRSEVWTPTPVDEQAVGEAFRAYAAVRGGDDGWHQLGGGGGLEILRCLNATTFLAAMASLSRRHRGDVMRDLPALIAEAVRGVHAAVKVWGEARQEVIELPTSPGGALVELETVIPGFFRHMLTRRKGALVSVLPGRSEAHVKALAQLYPQERQDPARIVRTDLAGAWTRYQQEFSPVVQRASEAAIGTWLRSKEPVVYQAS